jgi:hypothetical protein
MDPIGCLQSLLLGMRAAAADSKILLRIKKQQQQLQIVGRCYCGMCGKKLMFAGTSVNP